MRRTKTLRLQKPEPGDVYSSNTITSNTELIDKMLANIGGNVPVKELNIKDVISLRSGFKYNEGNEGTFKIHGNGLVSIEVNFTKTSAIDVNTLGMMGVDTISGESTANVTVADIKPEYAPAIAQPLTSGGFGPAVHGYVAPTTPRVVVRLLMGSYSGTIPANTVMQLQGIYPLKEVPGTVSLEQMNKLFDNTLHVRNLVKVDSIAKKLKTKDLAANGTSTVQPIGSTKIESSSLLRSDNGLVNFRVLFTTTAIPASSTGDMVNRDVVKISDSRYFPQVNSKLVSINNGRVFQGEVGRDGVVSLTSYAGNNSPVPVGEQISLAGSWMPRGD